MLTRFGTMAMGLVLLSLSASADVAVVKEGQSRWQIVTLTKDGTNTAWAAAELQRYLLQISGCPLPIEKKEKRSRPIIVVGLRNSLSEKDRNLLPPAKSGFDGFSIVISEKPDRIIIAGDNLLGTVYGVYEFLEQLGC